jgi:outer membrane protein assembly factor BamD (BamD/ComL family)
MPLTATERQAILAQFLNNSMPTDAFFKLDDLETIQMVVAELAIRVLNEFDGIENNLPPINLYVALEKAAQVGNKNILDEILKIPYVNNVISNTTVLSVSPEFTIDQNPQTQQLYVIQPGVQQMIIDANQVFLKQLGYVALIPIAIKIIIRASKYSHIDVIAKLLQYDAVRAVFIEMAVDNLAMIIKRGGSKVTLNYLLNISEVSRAVTSSPENIKKLLDVTLARDDHAVIYSSLMKVPEIYKVSIESDMDHDGLLPLIAKMQYLEGLDLSLAIQEFKDLLSQVNPEYRTESRILRSAYDYDSVKKILCEMQETDPESYWKFISCTASEEQGEHAQELIKDLLEYNTPESTQLILSIIYSNMHNDNRPQSILEINRFLIKHFSENPDFDFVAFIFDLQCEAVNLDQVEKFIEWLVNFLDNVIQNVKWDDFTMLETISTLESHLYSTANLYDLDSNQRIIRLEAALKKLSMDVENTIKYMEQKIDQLSDDSTLVKDLQKQLDQTKETLERLKTPGQRHGFKARGL